MSFQDQRPCVIYRGCMLRQGNGVPFFLPGPSRSSPWSFRRKGLSIGDLVILTEEGSYNFLFNVHAPADHELNAGNVPTNFEPLKIPNRATVAANDEHATSFNMEASAETPLVVGVGGSASIELSTSRVQEAFLMLPDGATRYDAMNEKLYERYAEKYAESWREYVDDLGHHLPNGSLYLVTGCDKAPTWGLAFSAFSVGAGFTYRTSWSGSTGTTTRSYPPQGVDLAQNSPPQKINVSSRED
ncbi:hypothetical protein BDZ89DRAFT_1060862 [Hymenopellis radicata]|nr:hypothetical protein BDZ89DRAFT_1060862 [Hymenopellis radicata]